MSNAVEPLVLVVDDEEPIRQLERRILESGGYRVIEASRALEAFALLQKDLQVDLVIADLQMPDLGGEEMARRIRRARPDIKVLYVTGHIDELMDERSTLWEGEAFLDKPFTAKALLEAVSLLLYKKLPPDPKQYTERDLPSRSFDYAWAAASGVLLALSFPKYGHPAFAWIALTPLLVALAGRSRIASRPSFTLRRAFLLGLVTGVVYFIGTLYWITQVMAVYGGLQQWVAVLVNAALIAYLALFPAVFGVVMRRIVIAHGRPALMAAPLVWAATELGRTYIFTGFPWVLLGYSQTTVLPIAQFASLFGVYGVSMLVVTVSARRWPSRRCPGRTVKRGASTHALVRLPSC